MAEGPGPRSAGLPTLRQLHFLTALKAHGGFVRAADAVGVTQPTLSAGIKELELALGVTLVDRSQNGALLTAAGEEAARRAAAVLADVEDLAYAVRETGSPLAGLFRLGAIPTIAPFLLPAALSALKAQFPRLRLVLKEEVTSRLVDALRARALDAAIIALPYAAIGIDTEVVADDEFVLACPPRHKLAANPSVAPDALEGEDVLLLEDGHCLREHALAACRVAQSRAAAEVGATSLHTLVQMVAGGLGVTLLPKLALEGGVAAGVAVETRPFDPPIIGRSIGIAWRSGGMREKEARLIARALREQAFPNAH